MSQYPPVDLQNCEPVRYTTSPNGTRSRILVPATPPPIVTEGGTPSPAAENPVAARQLTPFVVRDTFDSGTPSQPPPPLTQPSDRFRGAGQTSDDVILERRDSGRMQARERGNQSSENSRESFRLPNSPVNTPEQTPSPWGSTPTAQSSSPLSFDLDTTVSSDGEVDATTPAARAGREREARAHARAQQNQPASNQVNFTAAGQGRPSQAGTDYFAFFNTPPHFSATPRAADFTRQESQRVSNNAQATIPPASRRDEGQRQQLLSNDDAPRRYNAEHRRLSHASTRPTPPRACVESRNDRKRLWTGSPDPEDVRRSLRRPRHGSTPIFSPHETRANAINPPTLDNPWAGAQDGETRDWQDIDSTTSPFIPVASSTPPPVPPNQQGNLTPLRRRLGPLMSSTRARADWSSQHLAIPSEARSLRGEGATADALASAIRDGSMDVDDESSRDDSPEPEPKRNKGKGRATVEDVEEEVDTCPDVQDDPDGGWSEAQLLEAWQRSMRQYVEGDGSAGTTSRYADRRTGREENNRAAYAGPSRTENQYASRYEGAGTHENTLRGHHSTQHQPREHGTRASVRYTREDDYRRAGDFSQRDRRSPSAYVPAPNTRAAQHLASHARQADHSRVLPQRSPISRMASLRRSPSYRELSQSRDGPDWRADQLQGYGRFRDEPRDVRMMADDDDEDVDEEGSYGEAGYPWHVEAGEILPDALRGEELEHFGEPTAIPANGFPIVYRDDPGTTLRGMARDWVREVWSDAPNTGLLVDVYNYQYTEDDAYNRRIEDLLRRQIGLITGEADFDVVPPEIEEGLRLRTRDMPTLWAIRNLPPRGVARILERRVWSFPSLSFLAFPRTTSIPDWLFMLEGMLRDDDVKIRAAILRVLDEPEMRTWLERMVSANPDFAGLSTERAMRLVLRSLRVETLQLGNGNYVTNVWMRSPTRDAREWRRWVAERRARRYRTFAFGTGRVRQIVACSGCRSVSHPTHLCPFAMINGWNGPGPGEGVFGERRSNDDAWGANNAGGRGGPRRTDSGQHRGQQQRNRGSGGNGRHNNQTPRRDHQGNQHPYSRGGPGRGRGNGGGAPGSNKRRY